MLQQVIAQRGINEGIAYAKERVQFGKPVIKNQAMQFKVEDMEQNRNNTRQMVAICFNKDGYGLPHSKEAAIAKCYASIAMEVASSHQMFVIWIQQNPVVKKLQMLRSSRFSEGSNETRESL